MLFHLEPKHSQLCVLSPSTSYESPHSLLSTTKRSFSDQGQEQNISTNTNVNIKKAIGQRVYLARIIAVG